MLLVACSTRSKTQCLVNLLVHGYLKHLEKKRTQSDKKEKSQGSILTKQNKQTNKQTNKRTNKQTNKQTATATSSATTTTTTYPVTNFLSLVVVQKLYFWESVIKRCWNVRANKIAVINHGSISLLDGFRNV